MSPDSRNHRIRTGEPDDKERRSPFERDRDRILYSWQFRRLADITQVVHTDTGHYYHNRLTHSLKVAQAGERLAQYLIEDVDSEEIEAAGGLDESVVKAAALAHDIGHPPFGHAAESYLQDEIVEEGLIGGFEGNPQSFRVVNNLAVHSMGYRGLDLTYATLNAMLKYPRGRSEVGRGRDKWGYYATEEEIFETVRELPTPGSSDNSKSLEASIMDWADDLAYAIHDFIDFYKAGLIPIDEIFRNTELQDDLLEDFEDEKDDIPTDWDGSGFFGRIEEEIAEVAGESETHPLTTRFTSTPNDLGSTNFITSQLTERYLGVPGDVHLSIDANVDGGLDISNKIRAEVKFLKFMAEKYVFKHENVLLHQEGQKEIVKRLFDVLYEASDQDSELHGIIPEPYKSWLDVDVYQSSLSGSDQSELRARYVADIISSLTETQAHQLYERLSGVPSSNIVERTYY